MSSQYIKFSFEWDEKLFTADCEVHPTFTEIHQVWDEEQDKLIHPLQKMQVYIEKLAWRKSTHYKPYKESDGSLVQP